MPPNDDAPTLPIRPPAVPVPVSSMPDPESPRVPVSIGELFLAFNRLALQGFGGVLPIAQRELVERRRWLTREQFVEILAVAQVLPGPNIINVALMFGDRTFGWRGAMAALGGMLLAPLCIVLSLTVAYTQLAHFPVVAGALRGMGAVSAGLIFATGIKLSSALRRNPLGMPLALAAAAAMFLAIGIARQPMILMLAVIGTVSCALAWRRLKP